MSSRPIDESLVRDLLTQQHPDLARLPISPPTSGWDNAVFQLGERLAVRLPRRSESVPLIANEQRWLPVLEEHLPLPIPVPLRTGTRGVGYPWPWSICPWLPGEPASTTPPADPVQTARRLGAFIGALQQPAPPDAPINPYRGTALALRTPRLHEALARVGRTSQRLSQARVDQIWARWRELVDTPPYVGPPLWLHGDLHPANLLIHNGALCAVIDFGDVSSGDPATDLAVGWMLFDHASRNELRRAVGTVDDHTWLRAEAWALALAVAYLDGSPDGSPLVDVALRTLAAVLDDPLR